MRTVAGLLTALVVVVLGAAAIVMLDLPGRFDGMEEPETAPGFVDKDCADFATQAKAQGFFERRGGPEQDPHLLDPDHDGIACETRPCPCAGFGEGVSPARELESLLPRGTRVTLLTDPTQDDTDRFDRLLRYVEVDGGDIGLAQVKNGFAAVYDVDRPVFGRFDRYDAAERRAQRRGAGNWAACGGADG